MLVELAAWVTLENRAIVCILILLFIFNTVNLTYRYVKLAAKYKSEINKLEELKKELGDETDD
jgi:mannose/fructose/N-acetylgalactosamine-specific phosphotransferase system component IID